MRHQVRIAGHAASAIRDIRNLPRVLANAALLDEWEGARIVCAFAGPGHGALAAVLDLPGAEAVALEGAAAAGTVKPLHGIPPAPLGETLAAE